MVRILTVGKYYPPYLGGMETCTRDLCEHFARSHRVTAVVHNHEPGDRTERVGGVRVVRCATPVSVRGQPISPSMWRALDPRRADVVHFHAPNFFACAVLLLRLAFAGRRVPVVVTHHMDVHGRPLLRAVALPLYRALVRRAAAVIVTSLKNAVVSLDLPRGGSIHEIPLGLDPDAYVLDPAARLEADAWRFTRVGAAPTVGFVGRHARYKGLEVLLHALAGLPGVHAFVAGDGPNQPAARALAAELGVADRVHWLGSVSHREKLRLLAASDVFAFPSTERTEAFGVAQLEAMAMGVPVVASDLPTGVTDVAVHERTALLAPPGDPEALAAALRRLLDDRALARRLARRARARIRRDYARDALARRVEAVLLQAVAAPIRPRAPSASR